MSFSRDTIRQYAGARDDYEVLVDQPDGDPSGEGRGHFVAVGNDNGTWVMFRRWHAGGTDVVSLNAGGKEEALAEARRLADLDADDDWSIPDFDTDELTSEKTDNRNHYLIFWPENQRVSSFSPIGQRMPGAVYHDRAVAVKVPRGTHGGDVSDVLEKRRDDLLRPVSEAYQGSHFDGSNQVGEWGDDWQEPSGPDEFQWSREVREAINNYCRKVQSPAEHLDNALNQIRRKHLVQEILDAGTIREFARHDGRRDEVTVASIEGYADVLSTFLEDYLRDVRDRVDALENIREEKLDDTHLAELRDTARMVGQIEQTLNAYKVQ